MLNLRKSAVHVSTVSSGYIGPFGRHKAIQKQVMGGKRHFECRRCRRDLPEAQFQLLHHNSNAETALYYLHPICDLCRELRRSEWSGHPLVTPRLQIFVRKMMPGLWSGARGRGIVAAIEEDDVIAQYIVQGGKCAMTGQPLTLFRGSKADKARTALSVDRVDSYGSYTIDNIQLTCRAVNIMRMDMSLEEFGLWCARVMAHAIEQEDQGKAA